MNYNLSFDLENFIDIRIRIKKLFRLVQDERSWQYSRRFYWIRNLINFFFLMLSFILKQLIVSDTRPILIWVKLIMFKIWDLKKKRSRQIFFAIFFISIFILNLNIHFNHLLWNFFALYYTPCVLYPKHQQFSYPLQTFSLLITKDASYNLICVITEFQ